MNCWKFKNCGREPGGENVQKLGICRASVERKFDGIKHGVNAGRYCWKVKISEENNNVADKTLSAIMTYIECDFFIKVKAEERNIFNFLI
jgi:hypothetical protein